MNDSEAAHLDAVLRAARARRRPVEPMHVDDGLLRAWQAGALDEDAAAQLEGKLADSPEARTLARAQREATPDALLAWAEAQMPRRPRVGRFATLALAAGLILAAGLWSLWRASDTPVPAYSASSLLGGAQTLRGEATPASRPVFLPDGRLTVKLRPEQPGPAPAVAIFVAAPGEPLQAATADVQTAPGGGLVISAATGALFGDRFGPWQLYVVLGRPAKPIAARPAAEAAADNPATRWFEFGLDYAEAPR